MLYYTNRLTPTLRMGANRLTQVNMEVAGYIINLKRAGKGDNI